MNCHSRGCKRESSGVSGNCTIWSYRDDSDSDPTTPGIGLNFNDKLICVFLVFHKLITATPNLMNVAIF